MAPKRRRPTVEDDAPSQPVQSAGALPPIPGILRGLNTDGMLRMHLPPSSARQTTSYGSPAAPTVHSSLVMHHGTDMKSAARDIFAAVRRDNKRLKQSHEPSQPGRDKPGESSQPGPSRKPQPVSTPENNEPGSSGNDQVAEQKRLAQPVTVEPSVGPRRTLETTAEIEAELKKVRTRREARERAKREEDERVRLEREQEQAAKEQAELEEGLLEQAMLEQIEQDEKEEREQQERERQEREQDEREQEEREQEEREQEEREQEEREQEEREQEERDRLDRERQQNDHAARVEEQNNRQERERAEREATTAAAQDPQDPVSRVQARAAERRKQNSQKRAGEEFLDDLFESPKRPRNNNITPSAPHLRHPRRNLTVQPGSTATTRSFIEESRVFRDADVQTPAPSSVAGDTPSRPAHPSSSTHRAVSLPPMTAGTSSPGGVWNVHANLLPEAIGDNDAGQERPVGPGFTPRRSKRQPRPTFNHQEEDQQETLIPPLNRPLRYLSASDEPNHNVPARQPRPDPQPRPPRIPVPPQIEPHKMPPRPPGPPPPGRPLPPGASPTPPPSPPPGGESSLFDRLRRKLSNREYYMSLLRWLGYFLAFLFVVNTLSRVGSSDWQKTRGNYGLDWYGWSHMGQNIRQFVPYSSRHPLGSLADDEYTALRDHIESQDGKILKLTDENKDLRLATQKLESILPKVVSVMQDKSTGKLVIGQDFWHALKEKIHRDQSILTLQPGKDGSDNISDKHWLAVLKRLKAEGIPAINDIDGSAKGAVSSSWESWFKTNRGKVDKIQGSSPGQSLSPEAEKKLLAEADKLIRDKITGPGLRDIVITREEFIREVEKSLNTHKKEVQAEIAQVQASLKDMVDAATKAATKDGMTRQEIITMTNEFVKKAVANARLEGAAKGHINTNFEAELSRRVNYFALGNGATIDNSLTSPTYKDPPTTKARFGSVKWVKEMVGAPRFVAEKFAALTSWEDAGHCWCAGSKPANILVRLAHPIVPLNLVMEHIDPAATLDPQAMPEKIEVWVVVDENARRQAVSEYMWDRWKDIPANHELVARGFLKVSEFTYGFDPATKGVLVHRMPEVLAKVDAATDLVLVRAVSNYGADHTCFYRVRLYGEKREVVEVDGEKEAE